MSADQDGPTRGQRLYLAGQALEEYLTVVPTDVRPGDPEHAADAAHRMNVILGRMPPDEPEGKSNG